MTLIDLPPSVLALASESGADVRPTPDGAGLDVGDSETSHVVRRGGGVYQVEEVQRGTVKRVVLRTSEEAAVVRFLALTLADRWRSVHGRAPLPPVRPDLPAGAVVDKSGPRRYRLRWLDDGVERHAEEMVEYRATDLAHSLAFPLDVVVQAVRDVSGRPVFSHEA